jgi:cell wall assembly regulator SMI1
MCAFTLTDRHDVSPLIEELVPRLAAMVGDVILRGKEPDGEPVIAHELSNVLSKIQLGPFGL